MKHFSSVFIQSLESLVFTEGLRGSDTHPHPSQTNPKPPIKPSLSTDGVIIDHTPINSLSL